PSLPTRFLDHAHERPAHRNAADKPFVGTPEVQPELATHKTADLLDQMRTHAASRAQCNGRAGMTLGIRNCRIEDVSRRWRAETCGLDGFPSRRIRSADQPSVRTLGGAGGNGAWGFSPAVAFRRFRSVKSRVGTHVDLTLERGWAVRGAGIG